MDASEHPLPDKRFFKIGEVVQLVGVPAHVLRYWEQEVDSIKPGKSGTNQRRYRRKDVEIFRSLKRLLRDERYTLAGARRRLQELSVQPTTPEPSERQNAALQQQQHAMVSAEQSKELRKLRQGLTELRQMCGK